MWKRPITVFTNYHTQRLHSSWNSPMFDINQSMVLSGNNHQTKASSLWPNSKNRLSLYLNKWCKKSSECVLAAGDVWACRCSAHTQTQVDRQMWPTHRASTPRQHHPLISPSDWPRSFLSQRWVCATAVFSGEGTSVWPLPVFLSGKIQQCFCSMPGNTFQETTREVVGERERKRGGGEMLISQQLKADKQGGAQRGKKTPNHAVTHNHRVATDTHFSHHLHQKGPALVFIQDPFFFWAVEH